MTRPVTKKDLTPALLPMDTCHHGDSTQVAVIGRSDDLIGKAA